MLKKLLIISLVFILPACTEVELASHVVKQAPIAPQQKSKGYFKVGKTYKIKGKRYTPKETYNFTQTGIASWYGPNFHGKKTANGEVFDKFELTAAHKTLQMPAIVRVTNLENGRSIIVRINDRGPFSGARIIDLSERSAELLDFKHKGTAKVKIQVLPNESRDVARIAKGGNSTRGYEVALNQNKQTPTTIPAKRLPPTSVPLPTQMTQKAQQPPQPLTKPDAIFIQAGSFSNVVKARALAEKVSPYGTARINPTNINGSKFYRVQLGPIENQNQANNILNQLASANIGEPILIRK